MRHLCSYRLPLVVVLYGYLLPYNFLAKIMISMQRYSYLWFALIFPKLFSKFLTSIMLSPFPCLPALFHLSHICHKSAPVLPAILLWQALLPSLSASPDTIPPEPSSSCRYAIPFPVPQSFLCLLWYIDSHPAPAGYKPSGWYWDLPSAPSPGF